MPRGEGIWRVILVGALAVATLAACGGDDDEDGAAPATTAPRGEGGENVLELEMLEYGYRLNGDLEAGLATITSTNTGQELHMAGFAKLKAGKTVDDLVTAMEEQGSPGGAEGGDGAPSEGQGGEEEEDPLAELIDEELNTPGHILQPGQRQSLTVDVFEPGSYVVLCFIPTEGEGTPHVAKGMVAGFEVSSERSTAEPPAEDVAVTLPDGGEPTGLPATLESGQRTFKLTSSGTEGKDFFVGRFKPGEDVESFDRYFESEYEREGGPARGAATRAPGTILGSTFAIVPDQTIWMTVDLEPGETFFLNSTNVEGEGDETIDKVVSVEVT